MADTEFYIYSDRNKLRMPCTSTTTTEYRVGELLKTKELKPFIKGALLFSLLLYINSLSCIDFIYLFCILAFKEELEMDGLQSIFKNFDKLFSVIEFIDQIDYLHLHDFFENILIRSKLIYLIC